MDGRGVLLMFVCLGAAFYMKLLWLAGLLVVVLLLAAFGSIRRPKAMVVPTSSGPRETIYPVIYEDVGAPYLYHPKLTKIKISPRWEPNTLYEGAAYGMGNLLKTGMQLVSGGSKVRPSSK